MDGNNGIDPEPYGDVDHNLGTLPVWDYIPNPPAYRGNLLLSDPYTKFKFDWDKLAHLEPRPDIHLVRLIDFEPFEYRVADLVADTFGEPKPDTEPIGVFHYNTDCNFNPHEHASKLTMAIIDRHLQAAYAEIAATLLGATGDDSESDSDTEAKAAPEADDSFDCWS